MNARRLPFVLVLLSASGALLLWWCRVEQARPLPPPAAQVEVPVPWDLGAPPDWSELDRFQGVVRRADFVRLMDEVFAVSPAWRDWFEPGERELGVRTGPGDAPVYRLRFADEGERVVPPRYWRGRDELPPAPPGRPLDGLRIAIDPGHIGGSWARMEERWFQLPGSGPVMEGDMTLQVARLLKPRLEAMGARVELVRERLEPVTAARPESLREEAAAAASGGDIAKLAERLFYRTAEIRARARRVNEDLRPDLVLCLHFNADAWGDPNAPSLAPGNHFHMILNGGYTDAELALADQRRDLLLKLLQGVHDEERALAASIAGAFVERNPMPPYLYDPAAKNARNVDGHPYLWARNLLANRLYQCPVAYFEPYVMNSREDHERIQAGDYEGLREVAGKPRPSIFREYADAAADGLARHFARRPTAR